MTQSRTTTSRSRFVAGDRLIVTPKDDDDCEAVARKGRVCLFVRYASVGHYAIVEFEDKKRVYFREQDVKKALDD